MKQSKKSIEANLRNKLAGQYKASTDALRERIASLEKYNQELIDRAMKAEQEKLEMHDELQLYKDWNHRLQEFMDMNDEDRKSYIENLRQKEELNHLIEKTEFFNVFKYMSDLAFL